jgi:tetratricopeptide (TPR) repeat protein
MNRSVILFLSIVAVLLATGCNNQQETSVFDEILSRKPYALLTDSIEREPNRDDLYFQRAVLLNKDNFPEPALADFQKAWSLKKEEKYAYAIGTMLVEKSPDRATEFLTVALKELPQSTLLRLSLAHAYDQQGKTDEALRVCDDILMINPQQVDVLKFKASLLDKKQNGNESVSMLEKAYSLTPYDIELNYILALKYAETKNPKVIALCDSLIRADSLAIHADPYYYKGIYFSNIGDKSTALGLFEQAIKKDYNFMEAYIEKGSILFDQKRFSEATSVFSLAINVSARYAPAYYWLAKCQEATGDKENAITNYQRAYGLDKTFVEALQAAEKLKAGSVSN